MPKYIFCHKKSKKLKGIECSMKDLDKLIEDNPDWNLVPSAPMIVSGVASAKNKPDNWFTDRLKEIKKKLPPRMRSNVETWR